MFKNKRIETLEQKVKELEEKIDFLWDNGLKRTATHFVIGMCGWSDLVVEYRYGKEIKSVSYTTRFGDAEVEKENEDRAIIKVENPNTIYLLLDKRVGKIIDITEYYNEKEI